jgi:hypothetical protein
MLIGHVELLTRHLGNFFLAAELLNALQTFFMVFVVVFDSVELHDAYFLLIFIYTKMITYERNQKSLIPKS